MLKNFNTVIRKYVLPLATLPNSAGFSFYGVTQDDKIIDCHVSITPQRTHFVANAAGIPVYSQLKGWFGK